MHMRGFATFCAAQKKDTQVLRRGPDYQLSRNAICT
jgi:hypothetical protein